MTSQVRLVPKRETALHIFVDELCELSHDQPLALCLAVEVVKDVVEVVGQAIQIDLWLVHHCLDHEETKEALLRLNGIEAWGWIDDLGTHLYVDEPELLVLLRADGRAHFDNLVAGVVYVSQELKPLLLGRHLALVLVDQALGCIREPDLSAGRILRNMTIGALCDFMREARH